jgi:hypothetical protein
MQYSQGNIYILDVERRDIVSFDENFNNMHITGEPGQGPEELTAPCSFYVSQDTIFILDVGAGGIKRFFMNKFLNMNKLLSASENRFFCTSDNFVVTCVRDSSVFTVINKNLSEDNLTQHGGKITKFETGKETFIRNEKDLLYDNDDFFYAVSNNLTKIEKYDLITFNFVSEFDISDIPIINDNLKYISSQKKESNSYYVFINDSYIANGFLFLLCSNLGRDYKTKQIIKISLNSQMEVVAIYTLPGDIYNSFCVSSNYIFAFNRKEATIDRIRLSDYD